MIVFVIRENFYVSPWFDLRSDKCNQMMHFISNFWIGSVTLHRFASFAVKNEKNEFRFGSNLNYELKTIFSHGPGGNKKFNTLTKYFKIV